MNNVWLLDDCENENCDIEIFIPGPPGPPSVDVGSISSVPPLTGPVVITNTIAAPVNRVQRSFISCVAPVNQPAIPNPGDNGPWQLTIYVAPGSSPVTLNNAANIKLSGEWVGGPDSIIMLEWDSNSRYVEGYRNEI